MDAETLATDLAHFSGSDEFTRTSRRMVVTAGVKFLADKAGAYWLIDLIDSHQSNPNVARELFQVWTLTLNKSGSGAKVEAEDGNGRRIAVQRIPYTDFPLKTIKLYCEASNGFRVTMLPGER
jgi:hypothetical protein